MEYTKEKLTEILKAEDFTKWYEQADALRREMKGDYVEIRALLEFSNYCRCDCTYCGLRAGNGKCTRYRMEPEEMVETARAAWAVGYQTIVLQSGEDVTYSREVLGEVVREISGLGMTVTLSCGERSEDTYAFWKECGAKRYLMKQETADAELYAQLHPGHRLASRVEKLKILKRLGYEIGSGFMIGLPGQTEETIAQDLLLLRELGCDMAGIGPFIPHPGTPLGAESAGSIAMTMRAVAMARILLPESNLPATTALHVLEKNGRSTVFERGANVVMQKVTPKAYQKYYEIYPANFADTRIEEDRRKLEETIRALGRIPR